MLYAKPGGATSGNCDTPATAGTLKYVMETNSLWAGHDTCVVMAGPNGESHEITEANRILADFPSGTSSAWKWFVGGDSSGRITGQTVTIEPTGTWSAASPPTGQLSMLVFKGTQSFFGLKFLYLKGNNKTYNLFNNSGVATGTSGQTNTTTSTWTMALDSCILEGSIHHAVSTFMGPNGAAASTGGLHVRNCRFIANGLTGSGHAIIRRPLSGQNLGFRVYVTDSVFIGNNGDIRLDSGNQTSHADISQNLFKDSVSISTSFVNGHSGVSGTLTHNIWTGSDSSCVSFGGGSSAAQTVTLNVFLDSSATALIDSTSNATYGVNSFSGNVADFSDEDVGTTVPGINLGVAPLFKDAANNDYRQLLTSPPLQRGLPLLGTYIVGTNDVNGNNRYGPPSYPY